MPFYMVISVAFKVSDWRYLQLMSEFRRKKTDIFCRLCQADRHGQFRSFPYCDYHGTQLGPDGAVEQIGMCDPAMERQ